ncbi:hypothetical protein [Phenylobacterium sp.]|uniref:hypothetical protein n=1 Tax=Phenylobacterium sp. TaxID=1871053 RepID=UPI002BA76170|nr:hypothetical protein [Phenylobacterium sp.]HLZ75813.1 hypothetical protein [Phenylobacterium sp.]
MIRALIFAAAFVALASSASAEGVPRAADGHADLSGVWSNASVTHLTRPPGQTTLTISKAEAEAFAKSSPLVARQERDAAPIDPKAGAPGVGDPGGYNAFWLDPGNTMGEVKGQYRTSWIVDPADGQLPLSAQGKALVAKANAYSRDADRPDNPEAFEPWDRCIISSRGSGGPGMLNNIYNSNYQILQTAKYVVIEVEMIHDARGVPVFASKAAAQAAHGPAALALWLGDSTAWWEGDTLVIETVNVNAEQGRAGPIFLTPKGRVTERLTRVSAKQILYAFEVEDPTYYTRPWKAEMSLNAGPKAIYEYACHEGNYALPDILSGMRAGERASAGKAKTGGE